MKTLQDFARFFVRFNGVCFIFWGFYTLIDLPPYYRNFRIVFEAEEARSIAAQDLWSLVLKVALQLVVGVLLIGATDQVINWVSHGQWKKLPNQPVHTNAGEEPPASTEPEARRG